MKKYKKNYLKSVIFRLDFLKSIELISFHKFADEIKETFPISQQKEEEEGSFSMDLKRKEIKDFSSRKINFWLFHNRTKTKELGIHSDYLYINYNKYKNSGELLKDINEVVEKFISIFEIKNIKRMGLRYVNEIELDEKRYLSWEKYINNNLLGSLKFATINKKAVVRSLGQLVFKEEFGNIVFIFGIRNLDYPDEINRKEFILDFDYHSVFPFSLEEIDLVERTKSYNQSIERLFEATITRDYRNLLNK